MQLKFKLGAIASALALVGTGLGVASAEPAAAKDAQTLCVVSTNHGDILCAFNFEGKGDAVPVVGPPGGYWNAPDEYVGGQISSTLPPPAGGKHLCLQLFPSDRRFILMEPCKGKELEEWTAEYTGTKGALIYINESDSLCLNVYPYGEAPHLTGAKCNSGRNQEFYGMTS
jgi:hypothetical protein